MKKQILYLLIFISATGILYSCENEISYNPQQKEPQLIMNALLDASKEENFVYLNLSGAENTSSVKDATITLYINNHKVETAESIPVPDYPDDIYVPELLKQKKFRLKSSFKPGDKLRLEAIAENGKYIATAEVEAPQPIENNIKVDTCLMRLKENSGWKKYCQFKITFNDRPNEKNYYRLDIIKETKVYGINYQYKDTIGVYSTNDLINREDFILTDGHPTTSDDENNGGILINIPNKYNVFSDSRFINTDCTLKVYVNTDLSATNILEIHRITTDAIIRILSISELEYRYLKALNCLESEDYDETIMEPVIIPCNVKGGLGFVGICTEASVKIQLSDVNWKDSIYTK